VPRARRERLRRRERGRRRRPAGRVRGRVEAEVVSVTPVGGRVRIGLQAGQPLVAEVTQASVERLGLRPGARVAATWKAAATRLVPR
jgi:molybdopterin-binding protein